ncbi:MAG: YcxB family protein [Verrucomicrobiales bacterium]|nr:YcxB family protein [Verrucomicrobiales bacterium]
MKLEYQISEDDFMEAYEAFWRSKNLGGKTELICGAAAVIGGVALLSAASPIGWILLVAGVILAALVPIRSFLHRRAYRENPAFSGLTSVSFEDEVIEVVSLVGESRLSWSVYLSAMESDFFFLPMISKRSFSIIPKRAFATEDDLDAFRELLESKLGPTAKI